MVVQILQFIAKRKANLTVGIHLGIIVMTTVMVLGIVLLFGDTRAKYRNELTAAKNKNGHCEPELSGVAISPCFNFGIATVAIRSLAMTEQTVKNKNARSEKGNGNFRCLSFFLHYTFEFVFVAEAF